MKLPEQLRKLLEVTDDSIVGGDNCVDSKTNGGSRRRGNTHTRFNTDTDELGDQLDSLSLSDGGNNGRKGRGGTGSKTGHYGQNFKEANGSKTPSKNKGVVHLDNPLPARLVVIYSFVSLPCFISAIFVTCRRLNTTQTPPTDGGAAILLIFGVAVRISG